MAKTKKAKTKEPSSNWTNKELQEYIRTQTKEVNKRIKSYKESVKSGKMESKRQLDEQIKRLQAFGTGNMKKDEIGLGFTNKSKSDLLRQAKALDRYVRWETGSIESNDERKEQLEKQYEGYKKAIGNENISFETYIELAETWGSVGNAVIQEFGYENLGDIMEKATDAQRENITPYMLEILKESKGQGWTMEDLLDRLNEKLQQV